MHRTDHQPPEDATPPPRREGSAARRLSPRWNTEMRALMTKPGGATMADWDALFRHRRLPGWHVYLMPAWLVPYAGMAAMIVSELFTGTAPDDTIPLRLRWVDGDLWRPVAVRASAVDGPGR